MQQPISFPDEPEDGFSDPHLDDPEPLAPVPFPGADSDSNDLESDDFEDPASYSQPQSPQATAAPEHAVSQREALLAQHRQRMLEQAGETPPPSRHGLEDDSALAFPTATESDQTPNGSVSQREAIMQQQREILLRQAGVNSARSSAAAQPPSEPKRKSGFTRRSVWATLIIIMSTFLLSGGAFASGHSGPLDQVASALTPDVVERWISDNIASLGETTATATTAPTGNATTNIPTTQPAALRPGSDVPPTAAQPLRAQIATTDGTGISVRAICITEARTATTLEEGAAVRIIGRGVGDCAGWSVVRAGAKTSWVEDRFLAAATP